MSLEIKEEKIIHPSSLNTKIYRQIDYRVKYTLYPQTIRSLDTLHDHNLLYFVTLYLLTIDFRHFASSIKISMSLEGNLFFGQKNYDLTLIK